MAAVEEVAWAEVGILAAVEEVVEKAVPSRCKDRLACVLGLDSALAIVLWLQ